MNKIQIFRVEDPDHTGMYSSLVSGEMFELQSNHPPPDDDIKLGPVWRQMDKDLKDQMRFGFASMDQLKFWIYKQEWREELDDEAFSISVYEVDSDHVHIGETQCVFLPQHTTKLNQLSLLEI